MKPFISFLAVAALMAALLVVSAMPAFAQGPHNPSNDPPRCEHGNDTAYFSPAGPEGKDKRSEQATRSIDKNYFGNDKNPNAAYCLREEE